MWDIVADFFQVYTQVFMDSSFAQWKILQISIILVLVSCFDTNSLATATRSKSSVPSLWQWKIATLLRRLWIIITFNQVFIRLAIEDDLSGQTLLAS